MSHRFDISLDELTDVTGLRENWLALQEKSACSVFQSWGWIGSLLTTLPNKFMPMLLTVKEENQIIGLGVFFYKKYSRHKVFPVNALLLTETGDPDFDVLTVEYNYLLCAEKDVNRISQACLEYLVSNGGKWDELVFSGVESTTPIISPVQLKELKLHPHVTSQSICNYISLEALTKEDNAYLKSLSSNTRYQIRRALRAYEGSSQLRLDIAANVEEALTFFEKMKNLHQLYWESKGQPGAFANPYFEKFHTELIMNSIDTEGVQLIRICNDEKVVGYLYNLVFNGVVSSYQSGFNYENDAKIKPGLVSHYLAIEFCIEKGYRVYDFLAGDSQYKRSLAREKKELVWVSLQKDCLKFKVEDSLRALKRLLKNS